MLIFLIPLIPQLSLKTCKETKLLTAWAVTNPLFKVLFETFLVKMLVKEEKYFWRCDQTLPYEETTQLLSTTRLMLMVYVSGKCTEPGTSLRMCVCDSSAEWGCVCSVLFLVQRCCNKILSVFEHSRWCYHEGIVTSTRLSP